MSATAAYGHEEAARLALDAHGIPPSADLSLLSLSENATYSVRDASGVDMVLRVHPAHCHNSRQAIESELDWLTALRNQAGVDTPRAISTPDGRRVVTVVVDGNERHVVAFGRIAGVQPDEDEVDPRNFEILGSLSARMHAHARGWLRPATFTRIRWDWVDGLGENSDRRWGSWEGGIAVGRAEREVLGPAAELVQKRLVDYGQPADRFGLIHADLRLANLLQDGEDLTVIDFDDCGFGWFMYDFATTISFLEDDPRVPEWHQRWITGYERVATLPRTDLEMLSTFVMFRRLLLMAWLGSHAHTAEAASRGPQWTIRSCELAERYLHHDGELFS